MKALVCEKISNDFSGVRLAEIPRPSMQIDSNQPSAVVRIQAAALNWPDYLMTRGEYQFVPACPFVLGMEASGIVEQSSSDCIYKEGDEVTVAGKFGAISQFASYHESAISPKPSALSFAQSASFQTAFVTAWAGLCERGQLKAGQVVLIHGASGGVGMAAVIVAKTLNCKVIATVSSDTKAEVVKSWGADVVINISGDQLAQMPSTVKKATENQGVDLVYDPVGGDLLKLSLRCVKWNAKICIIGFAGGDFAQLPSNLILIKGLDVLGVRAGEMGRKDPIIAQRMRKSLSTLIDKGCKPHIGATYSIQDAIDALKSLPARTTVGKTIIQM